MSSLARHRLALLAGTAAFALVLGPAPAQSVPMPASHTPAAASVTIAGSLQSEAGCAGDWDPGCATTHLTYDAGDAVWQATFPLPAGDFEYKAAIDDAWDENYGAHAQPGGANIALSLPAAKPVKFYYDHATHWVTDDVSSVIATVPGSFQSELGCGGDWQPDCLRSWLQDPDGDGTYSFTTTALPAGSYEGKVAINESWDENYGQGGAPGGANIGFTVGKDGQQVEFDYVAATHVLSIRSGHGHDGNVEWDGLRHDSRDTLYRTPSGAVPAGTPTTIRLRTFHDDVTGVKLRTYSVNAAAQTMVTMTRAASDVSCYQDSLSTETCDYWQATLANADPDILWYRFVVTDGTATAFYGDDTAALDGGLGAPTAAPVDQSWALTVYDPKFTAPAWAKDAVIYQIFPDRFRNGSTANDPKTGDIRYDDPVKKLSWGTLPEGYCRSYAGATLESCPWRFGDPTTEVEREQPRGRDYQGGDLKGVDQQLDYLKRQGITTIYLNPVFDAGSNHSYDTQDYTRIDPYFGTQRDFDDLVKHAKQRGMRVILDGVFNHLSSDSPFFDRYHHYATVGACESADSPYRSWFHFRAPVGNEPSPCAPSTPGGTDTYYEGWYSFDSIPVLDKTVAEVQQYFLTAKDSVAKHWLRAGASGWRMDVMGDPSFPDGYWETFRSVVKKTDKNALIVSETWQKDSTLLRMLRGDRADTTMNYRLRDAVIGLLAPGAFDSKGFPDSGHQITPSQFAARISSIQEDYPAAALYSAMNLLDSHDTERLLWTLTPGADNATDREDPANVSAGKQAQRLASLIQFSLPGAPTVYYGDEAGLTGDDDPDNRRALVWADQRGTIDTAMQRHYATLAKLRASYPVLRDGDLRVLLADDADGIVALGRADQKAAAITVVNRGTSARTVDVPVSGYLPDGVRLRAAYTVGGTSSAATVTGGVVSVPVPARGGVVLASGTIDRTPPSAPTTLTVTDVTASAVSLSWKAARGASGYDVFTSPVTGGGYTKANSTPVTGTTHTLTDLPVGVPVFVVVRARDAAGNLSTASNEVRALPHYVIGWANLQWPPTLTHTISAVNRTDTVYGQVWIDGVTASPGPTPTLWAQLGFGPDGSDPAGSSGAGPTDWTWADAAFNTDAGNNDEFQASLQPDTVGQYDYAYRYSTNGGDTWLYADLNGTDDGYSPAQAGALSVSASGDTTAPAPPTGLRVTGASATQIELAWDAVGDADLARYEVLRASQQVGPFAVLGNTTATAYTDGSVAENGTYWYAVRAVDSSFNRSEPSAAVSATAELRAVSLTFTVTVPAATDGTGRAVNIAGFLDRLDGNHPQWDPAGTALERLDATHWRITLTGRETTQIEYKYALGSWDYVEKESGCGEVANRQLTLAYGSNGTQQVNDTVANWRNVSPCGN